MDNKSKREGKVGRRERIQLKKRKVVDKENLVESPKLDQTCSEIGLDMNFIRNGEKGNSTHVIESSELETQSKIENSAAPEEADIGTNSRTHKFKKVAKNKKKDRLSSKKGNKLMGKRGKAEQYEVYHISSGDEDCSKGMKKWIMDYHQSRPELKLLQQRIDEFITAHEEQEERARKEREARAAEGGWTVVVHHKGRKKTTDSESGITVGSVAQAAVVDKMSKKKNKEVGLDFYRFQRREAQRNEVMMLQSKFEQDRKRIQQLRAARKFRPY